MKYWIRWFTTTWISFNVVSLFVETKTALLWVIPLSLLLYTVMDDKQWERKQKKTDSRRQA